MLTALLPCGKDVNQYGEILSQKNKIMEKICDFRSKLMHGAISPSGREVSVVWNEWLELTHPPFGWRWIFLSPSASRGDSSLKALRPVVLD